MEQKFIPILSCIIFLIALFLFEMIIPALGIAVFFFLLASLAETWFPKQFKKAKNFSQKKLKKFFPNKQLAKKTMGAAFFTAALSLAAFSSVFLPIEFFITEAWLITPKIHPFVGIFLLLGFIFLFSLIDWFELFSQKKFFRVLLLLIIILGFLSFKEIREEKLAREYLPKIYSIDRKWGIQAQIVKIRGVNFFPAWEKGKIILGDQEMIVRLWDEELIVAEQQVPTKFGQVELYLIREDGVKSNRCLFEIKNPDELKSL